MKILFTRGDNPLSSLICKLTKEDVSHCALQYGEWVLHANFYGVHWEAYAHFSKACEVVHTVEVADDLPRLVGLAAQYAGRARYDFMGLAYLGLRMALRLIGLHLPKKNLWQMSGMFLCTEWVSLYANLEADSEITPFKLYERLSEAPK
jgi:hypothetical protein